MPGFLSRLSRSIAWGVVKGIVYYVIVVYVSPLISGYLYASLARDLAVAHTALPAPTNVFLAVGFIFIGLSTAASALRGTIAEPLIRAVAALFGFAFTVLVLWKGMLDVAVEEAGVRLRVTLDLTPLLAAYFAFVTVPGAILPFIYFMLERSEKGDAHTPSP